MYRMKISEMASRAGVSAATLRYYDKKGILVPEYLDENTGYRYYSRQQLIKLSIINFMRELGLGIEEIKHMLETDDAESIHQALVLRREKIIDQMKTLAQQKMCFQV